MSKPRRTDNAVEPLSPGEGALFPSPPGRRWREAPDEGTHSRNPTSREPEPSPLPLSRGERDSTPAKSRHSGESGNPTSSSSFPRKRESSDVASLDNWECRDFTAALSKRKPPRHGKLQARSYKATGKFPVIDQGQSDVAGWTDDESLVINSGFPYVVFGDHTRAFKYVDRSFALGADGTQLLKPSAEYCPRFFYYACLQLDLPSRGYNRHFTFLKEKSLPLPPKPEQEKIAAVLWKLQRAIATQDKLLKATADLKASAMQRLFTHGLRGEPLKDTEIGPMPESWSLTRCEDAARSITVGVVVKPASHYVASGVPAFRSFNVREDLLDDRNLVYFTAAANDTVLAKSKLSKGDVLVVRTGYPGTSCVVPPRYEGANCIDLVIVKPDPEHVASEYLSRFFNSHVGRAQTTASSFGLAQQHLNVGAVKRTWLALPSIAEQRAIASALATLDRKLAHHRAKRAALNDLFQTLLHQLMTAQVRVADLDIDVSDVTDHFADADKMVGKPATATGDHFADAGKLIAHARKDRS